MAIQLGNPPSVAPGPQQPSAQSARRGWFRRRGRLLVIETDLYRLRAAVVNGTGNDVTIERLAESTRADAEEALAEAVAQLRADAGRLPTRALLITGEASPTVLELPVDPAEPRPAAQMQEMIRWELEAHAAGQIGARPLGAILVGREVLRTEQVDQVLEEQARRKNGSASSAAARFGELAVEMGLCTRQDVDAALSIQSRFDHGDEEQVCGWSGQPAQSTDEHGHRWLVGGLTSRIRDRWVEAFAGCGLELEAIYPLAACAAAAIDVPETEATVVLEFHAGVIGATEIAGGRVVAARANWTRHRPPTAEDCESLIAPTDRTVWIAGRCQQLDLLAEELAASFDRTVCLVPAQAGVALPVNTRPASLAGVVGAARHAWRMPGWQRVVCIPARPPAPPFWQRPQVHVAAVAAGVLVAMVLAEASLAYRGSRDEPELASMTTQLDQLQGAKRDVEQLIAQVNRLQQENQQRRAQLASIARRRELLEHVLPQREAYLRAVLDALVEAAGEHVVVDAVKESPQHELQVAAWAMSETAAREFAKSLAVALDRWNLRVVDEAVFYQTGRLGLAGYALDIRLAPRESSHAPSLAQGAQR